VNLSTVIVSHNPNRDWLYAAIDSARDFSDQIVVVNNGSTERFPPMSLHVEHVQCDRLGYAGGTNLGIETAVGDWIMLLDDDDLAVPEVCRELKNALAALTPRDWPDVFAFPISLFDSQHAAGTWGQPALPASLYQVNTIPNSSWFRRDAWKDAGGFRLDVASDWHFWATLMSRGCVFDWWPACAVRKRVRTDSFSTTWTPQQLAATAAAVATLAQPPGAEIIHHARRGIGATL